MRHLKADHGYSSTSSPSLFDQPEVPKTSQKSPTLAKVNASSHGSQSAVAASEKPDDPLAQSAVDIPSIFEGADRTVCDGHIEELVPASAELDATAVEWEAVQERQVTRESKYEEVLNLAREIDRAAAHTNGKLEDAKNRLDSESYPFIAAAAEFVEMFDQAPFELDIKALDKFLDEKNVPRLNGNSSGPMLRVMKLFKNEETQPALIGKRASVLAGLRLENVSSSNVMKMLSVKADRKKRTKGGMGKYIAIDRAYRRKQKADLQKLETPIVGSEPQGLECGQNTSSDSLLMEIRKRIADGLLTVRVGQGDLQLLNAQLDGTILRLTANTAGVA